MTTETEFLSRTLDEVVGTYDSKFSKEAVETLLKIHRNILHNEDELKFRQIRIENLTFYKKIWCKDLLQDFMLHAGWRKINDLLVFNSDEKLLNIIECLLEHRAIVPSEEEWDNSTKHEGKSAAQLREEELRSKAAIEREKELAECLKDKKYREELAQKVKMEIRADRKSKTQVFTQPVRGNTLVKGAKVMTLNSHPKPSK